jgi:hypothetical protein
MDTWGKSKLLAQISGRLVEDSNNPGLWGFYRNDGVREFPIPDLYDPDNMKLAWQVLNWMVLLPHGELRVNITAKFDIWWQEAELYAYFAQDAVGFALDKLLELATNAGLLDNASNETPFPRTD